MKALGRPWRPGRFVLPELLVLLLIMAPLRFLDQRKTPWALVVRQDTQTTHGALLIRSL